MKAEETAETELSPMATGWVEHRDLQARVLAEADVTGASVAAEKTFGDRRVDLINDAIKLVGEIKPDHEGEPPMAVAERHAAQLADYGEKTGYEVQLVTYSMDTDRDELAIYRPGDLSFMVESPEQVAKIFAQPAGEVEAGAVEPAFEETEAFPPQTDTTETPATAAGGEED